MIDLEKRVLTINHLYAKIRLIKGETMTKGNMKYKLRYSQLKKKWTVINEEGKRVSKEYFDFYCDPTTVTKANIDNCRYVLLARGNAQGIFDMEEGVFVIKLSENKLVRKKDEFFTVSEKDSLDADIYSESGELLSAVPYNALAITHAINLSNKQYYDQSSDPVIKACLDLALTPILSYEDPDFLDDVISAYRTIMASKVKTIKLTTDTSRLLEKINALKNIDSLHGYVTERLSARVKDLREDKRTIEMDELNRKRAIEEGIKSMRAIADEVINNINARCQ